MHHVTSIVACGLEFYLTCPSLYSGGAAISSADQFLREKEEDSSYPGFDDPLLPQLSYFEASYLQPIGIGEGYNLKLDGTTHDIHKKRTSTVTLLNQRGKMACRVHCFRFT